MDARTTLARCLIVCGTLINLATIALLLDTNHLSAEDARDHRQQAATILKNSTIERVDLPEWTPPASSLPWLASGGGLAMALTGIGVALGGVRSAAKPVSGSDWAGRA